MTVLNKITYIIDEAFKILCTFLITFIWSLYIKKELLPALTISVIVSILLLTIFHIIISNKKQKENLKNISKQNYLDFCYKLKLSSKTELMDFISLIYPLFELQDVYLKNENEVIYPLLKENLNEDDLLSICSCFSDFSTLNVICFSFTKSAELLSKKIQPIKINLISTNDIFKNNSEVVSNFSPKLQLSNKRLYNFKLLFINAFSSDKAKKYLLLSFLLIISMLVTPNKLLYTILASIALIAALICKLNIIK